MISHRLLKLLIFFLIAVCVTQVCFATPQVGSAQDNSAAVVTTPDDVFSVLVADTIRGLLEELLVIGLLVVGVGHFAHGRHDYSYYQSRVFRNRMILLTSVVLFVTYLRLTYFVEWENELSTVLAQARDTFDFWQSNKAAWMVILLTPLDLLAIVCLVGMFLAVAGSEFFGGDNKERKSIAIEVRQLYLFTGLAHAEFVVSWIALRAFTGEILTGWGDIAYHLLFASLHFYGRRRMQVSLLAGSDAVNDDSPTVQRHVYFYAALTIGAVSYTHLTLPTNREV